MDLKQGRCKATTLGSGSCLVEYFLFLLMGGIETGGFNLLSVCNFCLCLLFGSFETEVGVEVEALSSDLTGDAYCTLFLFLSCMLWCLGLSYREEMR